MFPVFISASVFMQLCPLPCRFLTRELRPRRSQDSAPLGRPSLHCVEFLFRPRPLPEGFKYAVCTSFSSDLIFVSAQNGALQPAGGPAAGESDLRALWVHGGGVPPPVLAAVGEARRGGPDLRASFRVPVPALGPSPEVKASPAQSALPALSPPRWKRGSQKRRPGEEWRHLF